MKNTGDFVLRSLGTETFLIPRGRKAEEINGVITLSETAEFIYRQAQEAQSFEALVKCFADAYGTAPDAVLKDLQETLDFFTENGVLEKEGEEAQW